MTATTPSTGSRPTALVTPMMRVLRRGALAGLIAVPAAGLVGLAVAGLPGLWGGLIGMGLAVAFFGVTVVVALLTAAMDPRKLGAWVLGSWLVKMIVLMVAMAPLREADFYSKPVLFFSLLVGTAGCLALEARIVATTRVPYVEPVSSS